MYSTRFLLALANCELPWVTILESANFDCNELARDLDSLLAEIASAEKYYKKETLPAVLQAIHDWKLEAADEVIELRSRYLDEKLNESIEEFRKLKQQAKTLVENNENIPTQLLTAGETTRKKINGYKNALDILQGRAVGIDEEMILAAKRFPLERLIDIDSRGFALCLWHSDNRPSLFCRNNYVHCFTCNHTGSAVDVYMELHGCTFKEAVLALNSL